MTTLIKDIPDRFFIDLAIGVRSFEDTCHAYGLTTDAVGEMEDTPAFVHRLAQARQVVEDDGKAFRARCRSIVNDSLPRLSALIHDPEVAPSVQLDAFRTLARYGELEPAKEQAGAFGPSLTLTIVAPGGAEAPTPPALPVGQIIDAQPAPSVEEVPVEAIQSAIDELFAP